MKRLVQVAMAAVGLSVVATQLVGLPWSTAAGPGTAASTCTDVRSSSGPVLAMPVATRDPDLCIARQGTAPNVRTELYVDGRLTAAFQDDACSAPNAGVALRAATILLPDGRAVYWGTLPDRTERLASTTVDGDAVVVPAHGPADARVFATVIASDIDHPKSKAHGAVVGGPAPYVAACGTKGS